MSRREDLQAGVRISVVAVVWGLATGSLALVAGLRSGSLGVIGTGCDVLADVVGSLALLWQFRAELAGAPEPEAAEESARHFTVGGLLLAATGLIVTGILHLVRGASVEVDALSVTVAAISLAGLPVLARVKYVIAARLPSPALRTDAHTTTLGAVTAAVALLGLGASSVLGWGSADAVAGLVVGAIAAGVALATLRGSG